MLLARPAGRHRRTSRSAMSAGRRRRRAAQALPNKRVLVVAHENITNNYYAGNNRSCLVSNCLFRVGGAACMLSNRCAPRCRAQARRAGSSTASLVHAGLLCCCCNPLGHVQRALDLLLQRVWHRRACAGRAGAQRRPSLCPTAA